MQLATEGPATGRSPLLGREREVADVLDVVRRPDVRVVTITGPSGVGKTALSTAVLDRLTASEHIGLQRVALDDGTSALDHPGLADALSGTSVLAPLVGPPPEGRRRIVELDGCERTVGLADAVADAVAVDAGLTVLATSVQPLGVPGEQVVPLGPLAVPSADVERADAETFSSVQLVRRSAELARPNLVWSDAESSAAARLARVLDGLPLALELAAARCRVMSVVEVVNLVERSSVLTALSGDRSADRHADLRRALEWSYGLLDDAARRTLRQLAVAVGGCTWELLAALSLRPGDSEGALVAPLTALVDARFVVVDADQHATRYRLPAAVRELALELLAAAGELDGARERHAEYFRLLAERSATASCTPAWHRTWMPLEADLPNFVAAIEHLQVVGRAELALAVATDLLPLWRTAAHPVTATEVLDDLVAAAPMDLDAELSARALAALAELSSWAALRAPTDRDPLSYLRAAREAAAVAGSEDATLAVANAAVPIHLLDLDPDAARLAAAEGLAAARRVSNVWWQARLLSWQAVAVHATGDAASAVVLATESRELAQATDDHYQLLRTCAVLLGNPEVELSALPAADDLLQLATRLHAVLEEGILRMLLAVVAPDPVVAAQHTLATLELGRRSGLWVLEELASAVVVVLAARLSRDRVVAEVSGGLASRWAMLQLQLAPAQRRLFDESVGAARAALGESEFVALQTRGSVQGWQRNLEVCDRFLDELTSPDTALTPREREVLAQLAKGLTNKEIALVLGLRPKTVGHHVSNIFRKLGVHTRTEAAAVTLARGAIGTG